jgi:hypothetical protein
VNTIEDRLRDAYQAAAATIPPEATDRLTYPPQAACAPPVTAQRRRRALVPVAAAAAVLAVAGLVTLAARPTPGPARLAAGTSPVPLGVVTPSARPSRYFLAFENNGQGSVYDPLAVYSAQTGRLIAALSGPRSAVQPGAAAALGDGSTFVVAATTGPATKAACAGQSRLYRLRLAGDGQPASLDPLALPAIAGNVYALAATPDGRTIAYDSSVCDLPMAGMSVLGVMSSTTGRARRWTWPKPGLDVSWLSLSADGRILTYLWQRNEIETSYSGRTGPAWTISQLPVTSASGPGSAISTTLTSGSGTIAIPARYSVGRSMIYYASAVTTGGRTVDYCVQVPERAIAGTFAGYGLMAVREYQVATRTTTTLRTFSGQGYCYLSTSGGQLLVGLVSGPPRLRSSLFRLDLRSRAVTPVPDPADVNPVTW